MKLGTKSDASRSQFGYPAAVSQPSSILCHRVLGRCQPALESDVSSLLPGIVAMRVRRSRPRPGPRPRPRPRPPRPQLMSIARWQPGSGSRRRRQCRITLRSTCRVRTPAPIEPPALRSFVGPPVVPRWSPGGPWWSLGGLLTISGWSGGPRWSPGGPRRSPGGLLMVSASQVVSAGPVVPGSMRLGPGDSARPPSVRILQRRPAPDRTACQPGLVRISGGAAGCDGADTACCCQTWHAGSPADRELRTTDGVCLSTEAGRRAGAVCTRRGLQTRWEIHRRWLHVAGTAGGGVH